MTPADLARLHAAAFTTPRPWTEAEFTDLLAAPGTFLETAENAFLLARTQADETELLTLAVAPAARRQGLARALLARFDAQAAGTDAILEVAADNTAAIALYASAGWAHAGTRPAYYRRPDGTRLDAHVMRKSLGPA